MKCFPLIFLIFFSICEIKAQSITRTYDALHRLKEEHYSSYKVVYVYDRNNNLISKNIIYLGSPDLVLLNASISNSQVLPDSNVTLSLQVKNIGLQQSASSSLEIFLSTNQQIDGGDVPLGNIAVSALAIQNSYSIISQNVLIPGNTNPGNYYLLLKADATDAVNESDENNNVISLPISICYHVNSTASISSTGYCIGDTTFATVVSSVPGVTYQWQSAYTNIPGETNATYTAVLPEGAYALRCITTMPATGGCYSKQMDTSSFVNITIYPLPIASTINTLGNLSICNNDSVLLQSNQIGLWNTGEFSTQITVTNSGTYFISNSSNCGTVNSNSLIVEVNPIIAWYYDGDGDGYSSGPIINDCKSPGLGYVNNIIGNGDCNDIPIIGYDINPGTIEICQNGIDDNCNGQIDEGCCPTTYSTEHKIECNNFTWINGITYTNSGIYTNSTNLGNGCTHIDSLNLTIGNQWCWYGGDTIINQHGIYGIKGVSSQSNKPGGRTGAASWADSSGNFWIMGGYGYAANGSLGYLNDLWKFNLDSNAWTWISGSNMTNQFGNYGVIQLSNNTNCPSSRQNSSTWVDENNNLWLFGGYGYTLSEYNLGYLNDVWCYSISQNIWTWISGANIPNQNSIYGTKGIFSSSNIPSARRNASNCKDKLGNFWLFGGESGPLKNELWKFNPFLKQWAWVAGDTVTNIYGNGIYGNKGVIGNNKPGWRSSCALFSDSENDLWLFGGLGYAANGFGLLNDLWKFDVTIEKWVWIHGDSLFSSHASFGLLGISNLTNKPGARRFASSWIDNNDNLWILGGAGYVQNGGGSYINDLWKFSLITKVWTWMGGDNLVTQNSIYNVQKNSNLTSKPGARVNGSYWKDKHGNLWMMGGQGMPASGGSGYLSDLWRYSMPKCTSVLKTTLLIEGYYVDSNKMRPVLLNQGISNDLNITDSITIELHSENYPYATIYSTNTTINNEGRIFCEMPFTEENYFIAIRHRNSIETWSNSAVKFSEFVSYDFTKSANSAMGSNQKEISFGIFGIYSGDLNQDGYIDSFDFPSLDSDIFNGINGIYINSDLNGDGYVDSFDFPIFDENSSNGITKISP